MPPPFPWAFTQIPALDSARRGRSPRVPGCCLVGVTLGFISSWVSACTPLREVTEFSPTLAPCVLGAPQATTDRRPTLATLFTWSFTDRSVGQQCPARDIEEGHNVATGMFHPSWQWHLDASSPPDAAVTRCSLPELWSLPQGRDPLAGRPGQGQGQDASRRGMAGG